MDKAQSGLKAALVHAEKGVLIEGDAATPLADNSWFMIDTIAGVSTIPLGKIGAMFKTPDSGNAITPALGDNIFPLTLTTQCKVTADISGEKGVIDVSDDCGDGYVSNIPDGFTNLSGSYSQFMKFDDASKHIINAEQEKVLNKFYDTVADDGAGTYVLTDKNDDPYILFIFLNRKAGIGETQNVIIVPAVLSAVADSLENKAGITFDVTWTKAEGWAGLYKRILNVASDL